MPNNVARFVVECREALEQNPLGALPLKLRKNLLLALGPYKSTEGPALPSEGYYRRFFLAYSTAEKVEPFWERRLPGDDRPRRVLALAKAYVMGDVSKEVLSEEYSGLRVDITSMSDEEVGSDQYAGLAAVKTALVAMYDEDLSEADSNDEDDDLDVWSWSTAYTASIAYAYAAPHVVTAPVESEYVIQRRREFWRWWLEEAIPQAYEYSKTP